MASSKRKASTELDRQSSETFSVASESATMDNQAMEDVLKEEKINPPTDETLTAEETLTDEEAEAARYEKAAKDAQAAEEALAEAEAIDPEFEFDLNSDIPYPLKCDHSQELCWELGCDHEEGPCNMKGCHHVAYYNSDGEVDDEKEGRRILWNQILQKRCVAQMDAVVGSVRANGVLPTIGITKEHSFIYDIAVKNHGTCDRLQEKVFMNYVNHKAHGFYKLIKQRKYAMEELTASARTNGDDEEEQRENLDSLLPDIKRKIKKMRRGLHQLRKLYHYG
ncbi:MAG: hypothetical protein Q9174_003577 [Haloplaca sp. 1 TL-2023]